MSRRERLIFVSCCILSDWKFAMFLKCRDFVTSGALVYIDSELKEVGYMYEKSTEEIQCFFVAPELGLEPRTL